MLSIDSHVKVLVALVVKREGGGIYSGLFYLHAGCIIVMRDTPLRYQRESIGAYNICTGMHSLAKRKKMFCHWDIYI